MKLLTLVSTVIVLTSILACAAAAGDAPAPLAVTNRALGGGPLNQYTPGVYGGTGLNNIGLLIRTWGRVTYVDTVNKWFYIDDGAGRTDGTKRTDGTTILGIRVSYDNLAPGNNINPPTQGVYVLVTGISTTIIGSDGNIYPNVRPRRDTDVVSL